MTDKKLKPVIEYYESGKVDRAYIVDENGKEQGPCEVYHDNGQLYVKCTCKDGKEDGPCEGYYENGHLAVKCTYKDGKYDGPYERYYDNGQLWVKCVYKMGEELEGKEAEEYLKEWTKKRITPQEVRKGLCVRLDQINKQMAPTQLRQAVKRAEVAKFRAKFPNKNNGR